MSGAKAVSASYDNSYRCMKCYCKHLSKAAVEYSEFLEDRSRSMELSLCIGDLACAEDHASALGRPDDAKSIRGIRDRLWSANETILKEIRGLASMSASMVLLDHQRSKADAREAAAKALGEARRLIADSNDLTKDASNQ